MHVSGTNSAQLPVGGQRTLLATLAWVWARWKKVARVIGDFQSRVLLTLFYFVIFAPFALAVRWASDPLAIKHRTLRGWRPRDSQESSPLERARRQF